MSHREPKPDRRSAPRRGAGASDRRFWARYAAHGPRATLTWAEGAAERTIEGDLADIGGEGASFVSDAAPPPDVLLRLRLVDGADPDGLIDPVEAMLVESADDPAGRTFARIRFVHPCPLDLFDLSVEPAD
jgi:hypothetical protein